ncbi:universal stress protein [Salinarimonas soli]|uniref:Universal stress protein n=1 Tax=Salinarimonas soli TaxID=1638099 RepID=A0A5B2V9P2_9HYPH|nr:universal stress protein [Salinarimonas soli]KAA2235731.1 universal stress protein [Salinarimonas soli]
MKSLLVPTASHELMPSVLETALLVGRAFESVIEGFALRPSFAEYIPVDMVTGLTWVGDEGDDGAAVQASRDTFVRFMQERSIPPAANRGHGWRWAADAPPGDAFVGSHGRVFDLVVLGRPGRDRQAPSMATLEAALFESGRPILIAPPTAPTALGRRVMIAWNGSTETARATAFAMPFLARAESVVVLTAEGGTVPGPTGEQLARSLQAHGIACEARTVPGGHIRGGGEAILSEAAATGCDLLIKGAYTQSRIRQMIFGGATSHILAEARLPVLMAH